MRKKPQKNVTEVTKFYQSHHESEQATNAHHENCTETVQHFLSIDICAELYRLKLLNPLGTVDKKKVVLMILGFWRSPA